MKEIIREYGVNLIFLFLIIGLFITEYKTFMTALSHEEDEEEEE